jgi:hypothetical protein
MRNMALRSFAGPLAGTLIAAGAAHAGVPAASAASLGGDLVRGALAQTAPQIEQVQYRGGRYCRELRRACVYKRELGERGEGNCARYRAECGGSGYTGYREYRPHYRGYRAYRYRSYD